jgi:ribonuclease G
LRLRNLGGIIVVDFIDMDTEEHRAQVLQVLNNTFLQDHGKVRVGQFTEFGLVQIIRKRTHESLLRELCDVCPECEGRGMVKTAETLAYEICRELKREAQSYQPEAGFIVVASEMVINYLMDEAPEILAELELNLGLLIRLKAEGQYTREQYDIVPL